MSDGKRNLTVELPEGQLDALKIEAVRMKVTMKDLVHQIISDWQLSRVKGLKGDPS